MMSSFVIVACTFTSGFILLYLAFNYLFAAGSKYEKTFTETADQSLSEIFIFIDPKKLFVINLCAI